MKFCVDFVAFCWWLDSVLIVLWVRDIAVLQSSFRESNLSLCPHHPLFLPMPNFSCLSLAFKQFVYKKLCSTRVIFENCDWFCMFCLRNTRMVRMVTISPALTSSCPWPVCCSFVQGRSTFPYMHTHPTQMTVLYFYAKMWLLGVTLLSS